MYTVSMTAGGQFQFTTAFRNSVGTEVAGTWFDTECGAWKLSTLPIRTFPTEQDAVFFYRNFCDPETGMQSHAFRSKGPLLRSLELEVERGAALTEKGNTLLGEFKQALGVHREVARSLKQTLSKSNHAR